MFNKKLYCTTCHSTTKNPVKHNKGSGWIEILLWLCWIIPGLIYTLWRRTNNPDLCPSCKNSTLIPNKLVGSKKLEKDCIYCGEKVLRTAIKCKHCHSTLPEYIEPPKPIPFMRRDISSFYK